MKTPDFFVIKKRKKCPFAKIVIIVSAIAAAAAAVFTVYKLFGDKIKAKVKVLGAVDIDGDGETDAIMLDTTGDGEVDTIVLNSEDSDDNAETEEEKPAEDAE